MLLHYIRLIHLYSAWLHYRNRKHISRQYLCSSTSRSLCLLQLIFVCGISVSLLFNQKLWLQAPSGRMWPHFGCFLSSACFSQELGSFSKREMSNCLWLLGKKLFEDTFTGWSLLVRAPAALCDSVSCPLCAIAPPPLIVHLQDLLPMIVHLCIVQELEPPPPPHECSLVHSAK